MANAAVSDVRSAADAACPLRVHIRPTKQLAYLMGRCGHRPLQAFSGATEKAGKKIQPGMRGVYPASAQWCAPKLYIAASTRQSPFRIVLRAACMVTNLPMIVVAAQEHWRIDCQQDNYAPAHSPGNFRQIRRCVSIFENLVGADAHIRPYKSTTVMYTVFRLQSRIEIRLWLSTIACSTFVSTASHKHRCKSAPE